MKKVNLCFAWIVLTGVLAASSRAATSNSAPSALELARQLNNAFIEVADTVSPAVVVIRVAYKPGTHLAEEEETSDRPPQRFRRDSRSAPPVVPPPRADKPANPEPVFDGQGSGVVIREDGYLLTNFHVVEDAEKIRVRLRDGRLFDAAVRGTDPMSDLAVLKINARGLRVARFGNSDATRVGEFAIAIGAPFELENSVTFGHVSAKGRSQIVPVESDDSAGAVMDQDFLQTDASINPGNSGGPLVNIAGEVIGVNTLIHGMHTGIGFAVPSNLAREVAEKLIADGKFTRPWLGIGIRSLLEDDDYRSLLHGAESGVVVSSLAANGPAAKSDLRAGDIIGVVDGRPVATVAQLRGEVRGKKLGVPVTLDVFRPDASFHVKALKLTIVPRPWPQETPVGETSEPAPVDNTFGLGFTVQNLTRELAEEYDVDPLPGVIVTGVQEDGIADRKGLKPGDVITGLNQKPVSNRKQFRDALKAVDLKKGVMLNMVSDGASKFEVLKKEGE